MAVGTFQVLRLWRELAAAVSGSFWFQMHLGICSLYRSGSPRETEPIANRMCVHEYIINFLTHQMSKNTF